MDPVNKKKKSKKKTVYPSRITVKSATQLSVNGTYTAAQSIRVGIDQKLGSHLTKGTPVYIHDQNQFVSILQCDGDWYCGYYRGQTKGFQQANKNWKDYYVLEGIDIFGKPWTSMLDGAAATMHIS